MGRGLQVGGKVTGFGKGPRGRHAPHEDGRVVACEDGCRDNGGSVRRRDRRAARRAERRAARELERERLKRLPRKERLRAWWSLRPLGVIFTAYLVAYLVVATVLALSAIEVLAAWNNGYYELEVTLDNGLTEHGVIDSGPYIYDPTSQQLLPASELNLPGDGPYAVFIATGDWGTGSDYVPEGGRTISTLYATVDMVRSGQVQLYDWGLNYNEGYPQEEILEVNSTIPAENLARYDALSRAGRAQSVELFENMTGADLEETFGEGLVSNTAYYAASPPPMVRCLGSSRLRRGLCPFWRTAAWVGSRSSTSTAFTSPGPWGSWRAPRGASPVRIWISRSSACGAKNLVACPRRWRI